MLHTPTVFVKKFLRFTHLPKGMANFDPFGACACCNGSPCTAPVIDWTHKKNNLMHYFSFCFHFNRNCRHKHLHAFW